MMPIKYINFSQCYIYTTDRTGYLNFQICTCEITKDQFGLFLFSKALKHLYRVLRKKSIKDNNLLSEFCELLGDHEI